MTEYNGYIDNFIQGVNKQPDIYRLDGQVEEQINCNSSVTDGLTKRPGSELVAYAVEGGDASNSQYYSYSRGDGLEKYLFNIYGGYLSVLDLKTGEQKSVIQNSQTANYLYNTTGDLSFCTVKDTTFVVNPNKKIYETNQSPVASSYEYLIYAKKASYGNIYRVNMSNGSTMEEVVKLVLPSTVVLNDNTMNKQLSLDVHDDILVYLYSQIAVYLAANHPTATISKDEGSLYIQSDTDLKIEVHDSNNDTELFCIHQEVDKITDLPNSAKNGFKVKVTGLDDSEWNNYYVEFKADNGNYHGPGKWRESVGWGITQSLDSYNMPHKIVRNSDGSFTISSINWVNRLVGDDDTNPMPSFVGDYILSILVYQNRLVLSTSNTVCASCTDDYFNFFAPSIIESADTDPIDATSSGNKVTDLKHMLVFNGSLVIVGRESQYFHSSDVPFDSSHFALVPKTNYMTTLSCIPKTSATTVYLPYSTGKYTGIRTLNINELTNNIKGKDITDYVSDYIEGTCKQIAVTSDHSVAFIKTLQDNIIYVYKWYEQDSRLLQQSWSKWKIDFMTAIYYITIIDNYLYIYGSKGRHNTIVKINIQNNTLNNSSIPIHLDSIIEVAATTYSTTYSMTLPSIFSSSTDKLNIILSDSFRSAGKLLKEGIDYNIMYSMIIIKKDRLELVSGDPVFYIGTPFISSVIITNPIVKDYQNKPKIINNLKLKKLVVYLKDTGYLNIKLTKGSNTIDNEFDGRLLNSGLVLNNPIKIADYLFNVPVRNKVDNIKIEFFSDSYLPFKVANMSWTGTYRDKGRRTL